MSGGAIKATTENYDFNKINFDFPRWHTYEWDNWDKLDATLKDVSDGVAGPAGPVGPQGPEGPVGATGPAGPPGELTQAAADTRYVNVTGDKMTGALEIEAASPMITLDNTSALGSGNSIIYFDHLGLHRWGLYTDTPVEDLLLTRYNTSGVSQGPALRIAHNDGAVTIYDGPLTLFAGTQAAPSINFGSPATGLFGFGANQIGFSVSGVTYMTLDSGKLNVLIPILLNADPSTYFHAATKGYADTKEPALPAGGTTSNFLRGDKTWAVPAGGGTGVTDGDKGDIVVSGSGATWMFDTAVVTAVAKTVLDDTTTAAMLATLGADAKYVDVAGDTMSGDLTISRDNPVLHLNSPLTGSTVVTGIETTRANNRRWYLDFSFNVETGSGNAGSNIRLDRCNDAGSSLGGVFTINRATGVMDFGSTPTIGGSQLLSTIMGDAKYVELAGDSMSGVLKITDGTNAVPALSFASLPGCGIALGGGDGLMIVGTNAARAYFAPTYTASYQPFRVPSGAAATPAYAFNSSSNTGLFLRSASGVGLSCNGVEVMSWEPAAIDFKIAPTVNGVPIGGGGGSALVEVSDTPPASPVDKSLWWESDSGKLHIRYNDGDNSSWVQVNAPGGPPLPPNDNGEYVLVNGIWRLRSQSFNATGLSIIDIPVPPAARIAKLTVASCRMSVTGGIGFRWSVDGTTFPAGATDYTVAGFFHQSGTNGYMTQAIANVMYWNLTPPADNLGISHTVDLTMGLTKSAGGVFTGKWSGSSYNNTAASAMTHYYWTGYSNYAWSADQIKTMRVLASAGTFTFGTVAVDWIY